MKMRKGDAKMSKINMKESGAEWIGDVPESWKLCRVKDLITNRMGGDWGVDENGKEGDCICLRIADFDFAKGEFRRRDVDEYTTRNYSLNKIKTLKLKEGDILVEKSGGGDLWPVGRAVRFNLHIEAVYANFMDRLRIDEKIMYSPYFLAVWRKMYSSKLTFGYLKQTTGIQNLQLTRLINDVLFPVPSLPEQRAIVAYLDEKAAAIDRKVALLEKKLAAFKRLKTSIINRAVTRGLDPNVKLKDSGVDWIGQVPEGWEVRRVKNDYFLKGRIGWQGLKAEEFIDDGPWLITGTDFVKGRIKWETCYHVSEQRYYQDVGLQVREGDLLVTKDGTVGKLAYIDYVPGLCSLNSHLLLMRPLVSSRVDNKYMFWLLSSNVFRHYIEYESNGSTMQSLSQEAVSRFLYCAPAVAVQREIAAYLDEECAKIDKAAAVAEKQIDAYRRLKRSLINEVVTGKRKVA